MRQIEINWDGVIVYENNNSDSIPESSGVYEILVKQEGDEYIRRYVGETDDLNRRFNEHLSESEKNQDIKNGLKNYHCGFDFALIDDEDDRLDAEQGLYNEHEYLWNQQEPEGSDEDEGYEIEEI